VRGITAVDATIQKSTKLSDLFHAKKAELMTKKGRAYFCLHLNDAEGFSQ
jgi:hypothetical protein